MLNTLVVERQTPRMPKMSVTTKGRQKKLVSQETIIQTPAFVMTKVPERIFVRLVTSNGINQFLYLCTALLHIKYSRCLSSNAL